MLTRKSSSNVTPSFPNAEQFRETCLPQELPLPLSLMKYIWGTPPTPKDYQKLIQCCKLFFIKNPVLIIHGLKYSNYTGWTRCRNNEYKCTLCEYSGYFKVEMNKLKSKIWLTKEFFSSSVSDGNHSVAASFLISKLYRNNLEILHLFREKLTFNELKFLAAGVKDCGLTECLVQYNNGEAAFVEDIVKLFKGCKKLSLSFSADYSQNAICESYDELAAACKIVKDIKFWNFPVDFSLTEFYQCLRDNKTCTIIYIVAYNHGYLVNEVIDEILQTEFFDFVPPVIYNHGMGQDELRQLQQIQDNEAAKYV